MLAKVLFSLYAASALCRASIRVCLLRRHDFAVLVDRLRDVPGFALPLAVNPRFHIGLVCRLARWLPPYDLGLCLKRSLRLLDLLGRCGLSPILHLGVDPSRSRGGLAHAWVTVELAGDGRITTPSNGYPEVFVL